MKIGRLVKPAVVDIIEGQDLKSMTFEELAEDMYYFQNENEILKSQIDELYKLLSGNKNRVEDLTAEFEIRIYGGLTQTEYFRKITGTEITEGDFKIELGSPYENHVTVYAEDDTSMEWSVLGGRNTNIEFTLNRRPNSVYKNWYHKKFINGREVPKNRLLVYSQMVELKDKYLELMYKGEIEIPNEE